MAVGQGFMDILARQVDEPGVCGQACLPHHLHDFSRRGHTPGDGLDFVPICNYAFLQGQELLLGQTEELALGFENLVRHGAKHLLDDARLFSCIGQLLALQEFRGLRAADAPQDFVELGDERGGVGNLGAMKDLRPPFPHHLHFPIMRTGMFRAGCRPGIARQGHANTHVNQAVGERFDGLLPIRVQRRQQTHHLMQPRGGAAIEFG